MGLGIFPGEVERLFALKQESFALGELYDFAGVYR